MNANSLWVNLAVTGLVLVMVFVLPRVDRRVCARLGLNLQGGLSANPRADRLLRLRSLLLHSALGLYLAATAYLVFFSRSATADYQVHIDLYEDLKNAVRIDFGFLGFLGTLFTEGLPAALSHVRVEKAEDIAQVYMNVMLFVPMGYLLPYIYPWFRARARYRPALVCFVVSLVIENLQLIFRRGFYDMDDLVSNTLGGLIGQFLFISVAWVVTHPDWKKELARYRLWRHNARSSALYPCARRVGQARAFLLAADEDTVRSFYNGVLGFRIVKMNVPEDRPDTDFLMEMGRCQVEVHCSNRPEDLAEHWPRQRLVVAVKRLKPVVRSLRRKGVPVSPVAQDDYTGRRVVTVAGPEEVTLVFIEQ